MADSYPFPSPEDQPTPDLPAEPLPRADWQNDGGIAGEPIDETNLSKPVETGSAAETWAELPGSSEPVAQEEAVAANPPDFEPGPYSVPEAAVAAEALSASAPEPQFAPPPPPPAGEYSKPLPQPLPPSEERTWAMLAHLSILLNLVTGFLGVFVALIIYLVFRDRSRYVAYQSMQAFVFQLIWWVGAGLLAAFAWTISGLLAIVLIGCLFMPVALFISLIPIAALVYGVVGAIETSQGKDFKYWLIGDWVRGTLTGSR